MACSCLVIPNDSYASEWIIKQSILNNNIVFIMNRETQPICSFETCIAVPNIQIIDTSTFYEEAPC